MHAFIQLSSACYSRTGAILTSMALEAYVFNKDLSYALTYKETTFKKTIMRAK